MPITRRQTLQLLAATSAASPAVGCRTKEGPQATPAPASGGPAVRSVERIGAPPWKTTDPFLFCVHHDDAYPTGNEQFGPTASLEGRNIGSDFAGKDGWRMYHGDVVPGFPRHPHRGFETVTIVRRGLLDHADSLGAAARYGHGDVQWLTAGRGIQHAEMFPLLNRDEANPVELFQIWLNLPKSDKMAKPHFTMLWKEQIPVLTEKDDEGRSVRVAVVAGSVGALEAPSPPPSSYASRAEAEIAIWTIALGAGARWTMPPATSSATRVLYFFRGAHLGIGAPGSSSTETTDVGHRIEVAPDRPLELSAISADAEILVLQGRPIGEPVARQGPFVMNDQAEIRQAYADFQQTQFGGWPWERNDPVHGDAKERFARHADGRRETPT